MADNGHGMQQIMKSPIHSISSMKKGDWSGRSASETKFCSYNPVWQLWSSETVSSESFGMPLNIERFVSHSASCRWSSLDLGGVKPLLNLASSKKVINWYTMESPMKQDGCVFLLGKLWKNIANFDPTFPFLKNSYSTQPIAGLNHWRHAQTLLLSHGVAALGLSSFWHDAEIGGVHPAKVMSSSFEESCKCPTEQHANWRTPLRWTCANPPCPSKDGIKSTIEYHRMAWFLQSSNLPRIRLFKNLFLDCPWPWFGLTLAESSFLPWIRQRWEAPHLRRANAHSPDRKWSKQHFDANFPRWERNSWGCMGIVRFNFAKSLRNRWTYMETYWKWYHMTLSWPLCWSM